MLASLGQKRIAEDALIIGISVHRIVGGLLESVALGADLCYQSRFCFASCSSSRPCECALPQRCARRGKQAHRQIREPIAHFAKRDTGAVRRLMMPLSSVSVATVLELFSSFPIRKDW